MDALLMCGGRGTRLQADVEKPLFDVGERPMIDRVRNALAASDIETTYAVVSPYSPDTRDHLDGDVPLLETAGEGYVTDLLEALESVDTPVLTVAADLPLLEPDVVDTILERASGSTTVLVPASVKSLLGVSVDRRGGDTPSSAGASSAWMPTGVNVVDDGEDTAMKSYDARLAVNVNRRPDAAVAEKLLSARRSESGEDPHGVNRGP